jgi:quercetin dioxygenase-like cupin family protein
MMIREGLKPIQTQLEPHTHSPEIKFAQTAVRVLVSGKVQFSFPGYGVIELDPGDILEIEPNVLHDIMVGSQPAVLLEAFRD